MQRIFGLPEAGRASAAQTLVEHGFDSVVVGAKEDAESVRPALDAGLRVWGCRAAFTVRSLSETDAAPLLAQDVDGEPRVWFGSGCPNEPALREAHLRHVRRLVSSGVFSGFILDGIRFASPNAAEGFFTCFCARCEAKAGQLGFDFERMRSGVRELRNVGHATAGATLAADPARLIQVAVERWPGIGDWLAFRRACIVEHVTEVRSAIDRATVGGAPFQLGAYLFAPAFAPWVGQDYAALAPLLDVVSPMLYRTLGPGDACLTTEWASLAALRLVPAHAEFSAQDVAGQIRQTRALVGQRAKLVPILQLVDERLEDVIRAARGEAIGGLDFFSFKPGGEPYLETISRGTRARI